MQYTAIWLPCDIFFPWEFLSTESAAAAMWLLCPKQNSELYIFHEPKGPNLMLADNDLLPTKYSFFRLLPSFVLFIKDNHVAPEKYTVRLQFNYA